jgi:hypothetical protein
MYMLVIWGDGSIAATTQNFCQVKIKKLSQGFDGFTCSELPTQTWQWFLVCHVCTNVWTCTFLVPKQMGGIHSY